MFAFVPGVLARDVRRVRLRHLSYSLEFIQQHLHLPYHKKNNGDSGFFVAWIALPAGELRFLRHDRGIQ